MLNKIYYVVTNKKFIGFIGLLFFSLALIFFVVEYIWKSKINSVQVKSGIFVQTIVASGHVESPHRINISSQITGTVAEVAVIEGQEVEQGQLLLALENSELKSIFLQAQAVEQQSMANLRQMQELKGPIADQIEIQADANFTTAKNNLNRTLDLFDKGFIGSPAKDEAERTFRIAQSQRNIEQRQSASLRGGGSEIVLSQSAVYQAHTAKEAALARLRYSTIHAPRSGTLISRNVETGDGVTPGKVLMTLSPKGSVQLVLQIDEKNIKWLKINQFALASADAFPDQRFKANLTYINPRVDAQRGSVEIKFDVVNPPPELKQDMTVSVDIEISRVDKAIFIPLLVIHDYEIHAPWVLFIDKGLVHKKLIELGPESDGFVQVLSGLSAGDRLVPTQYNNIFNGSRIRDFE